MPTFQICTTTTAAHEFEVHADGCADVSRGLRSRKYNSEYRAAAADAGTLITEEVADFQAQEQDYRPEDFRVMNCARHAR
jgi:hypothetical protein